jgi:hypothetical protein
VHVRVLEAFYKLVNRFYRLYGDFYALRRIRKSNLTLPILILAARNRIADKVENFEMRTNEGPFKNRIQTKKTRAPLLETRALWGEF